MKVSYASLKLKTDTSVKEVAIAEGVNIEVLQYLPIESKYDLVMIALQQSLEEDGSYKQFGRYD